MTNPETDPAAQALKTLEQHIATLEAKDDTNTELIALMRVQLDEAKAESHRAWMARNHLMRKVMLQLGPNSAWTPEEIDAEMRAKGITVVVTPPDHPPPSPFAALAAALDLEPDALTAKAKGTLERWYNAEVRYPPIEKLVVGRTSKVVVADKPLIETKEFREIKNAVTTEMVLGWVDKDPERPKRVARWLQSAIDTMVDRSLPLIGGGFAKHTADGLRRKADQPGLRRFVGAHADKRSDFAGGDYAPLEGDLAFFAFVLMVFSAYSNRHLGGEVEQAFNDGLKAAIELEARKAYLAKVFEPGKPRWAYMQHLAHSTHALFMGYRLLYIMTGDKVYSQAADELRGYVRSSWEDVKLPGGLEGMITTHKVVALMKRLERPNIETTWHNSVYLEESLASMVLDAIIGGEDAAWTFDDVRKVGNLIYHTLMRYGWDGSKTNKIAGNMGGGGIPKGEKPRNAIRFTDGTEIPASCSLGGQRDGQPDYDEFLSAQRGHMFLPAAWSDVHALYAQKLPLVAKGAQYGRGGVNVSNFLCHRRREGKLEGVVT